MTLWSAITSYQTTESQQTRNQLQQLDHLQKKALPQDLGEKLWGSNDQQLAHFYPPGTWQSSTEYHPQKCPIYLSLRMCTVEKHTHHLHLSDTKPVRYIDGYDKHRKNIIN